MTIKELAETAGVSGNTINRVAKELFPGVFRKGRKTVFSKAEAFDIMTAVKKKNMVAPQNGEVAPQNGEVLQFMREMINQQQEFMAAVIKEIRGTAPKQQQLQLEAPKKTTRAELNQLVRRYATTVLGGDFSAAWRNLYSEILYRLSRNITLCAKNGRMSPIEYLEQENLLEPSCLIIVELLGEGSV